MKILSIETSCDETSAAVVEKVDDYSVNVLSNITATSLAIHATTGGIIPENAAREQVKFIIPVIVEALVMSDNSEYSEDLIIRQSEKSDNQIHRSSEFSEKANQILKEKIDAIAITYGPGLIGSLLVGVETAKTLSFAFNKPLIPVNHLLAHLFANFITNSEKRTAKLQYPFIGLIVSGGHTDLLLFKSLTNYKWLGGTRDDAAGEALDKIGRILNLSYPAGPEIERRANQFQILNTKPQIRFTSPLLNSKDLDFSFSGLKAEASRFIASKNLTKELTNEICYALQKAIFDVLIKKTIQAAQKYDCSTILLGGGVSANQTLLEEFHRKTKNEMLNFNIFAPERKYSTDNGAMIGAYAALNPEFKKWKEVNSQPDLYFS